MDNLTKACVFPILGGILAGLVACQKIPPPVPEVPLPAAERKVSDRILSLAGEVGERDPNTGHITIVILRGDKVDDKVLGELVPLKKLQILELIDTAVTKKGVKQLEKLIPELEIIQGKGTFTSKGEADKDKKKIKK